MRQAIWVLWPAFIAGGLAEIVFFPLFDPMDLHLFGEPVSLSRLAAYSLGFFVFWAFAAVSSALTCFLQRNAEEINRCPLSVPERPPACPKRGDPNANC